MYWLKAIGWHNPQAYDGLLFDQAEQRLDFAHHPGMPHIPPGNNVILVYGIGIQAMLYACTPISQPGQATAEEIAQDPWRIQWPYYIHCQNLTNHFGAVWNQAMLSPFAVMNEFHEHYPDQPITAVGGMNLGSINRGLDRVHLADGFGQFLYGKMEAVNNQ